MIETTCFGQHWPSSGVHLYAVRVFI